MWKLNVLAAVLVLGIPSLAGLLGYVFAIQPQLEEQRAHEKQEAFESLLERDRKSVV